MMNIDITKEYRMPISESLRTMRIQKCPLDCGDGIFVDDRLESKGFIRIYEYSGGTFYIPANTEEMQEFKNNAVPIAGISISIPDEVTVHVNKIYCEFGYEEYIAKLMGQIMNFADFYGLKVSISDLRKGAANRNSRTCRSADVKY